MSSLFEKLCKGEISQHEVEKILQKLRDNMATRAIAITTLSKQQTEDKKEASNISSILANFDKTRIKVKRSQFVRKSIHTLDEVFNMIGQGRIIDAEGDIINTNSIRYQLFKEKGVACVECGVTGQYFAKEKDNKSSENTYHFNLYGIDNNGKEVMLTRDHIKPQCKGGPDILENLQTMCSPCNCTKGANWDGE